jgi:hypothetical protein
MKPGLQLEAILLVAAGAQCSTVQCSAVQCSAVQCWSRAQDYGIMEMESSSKDLHIKAVKTRRLAWDCTALLYCVVLHCTVMYCTGQALRANGRY